MSQHPLYRPLRPDLDKFLYAAVGEQHEAVTLTMISALVRLDLDPLKAPILVVPASEIRPLESTHSDQSQGPPTPVSGRHKMSTSPIFERDPICVRP